MAPEAQYPPTISPTELMRIAEEAARNGRRTVVQIHGTPVDIAPHTPIKRARRRTSLTAAQREGLLRETFGTWKGLVDPDQLKQELNELQRDDAPPRSL